MDKKLSFDTVISALLDDTRLFPPKYLYQFSAITPEEFVKLKKIWPQIGIERRRALLDDLEDLSDKDDLLMLDDVGKIGLYDTDSIVITNAIRLLWHAEDKKLVPIFIQYVATHADEGVRATAASILGTYVYLGEMESIPTELHTEIEETLLLATRKDPSDLVRRRALEALGYSSRDEVAPLIRSAYANKDTLWIESALYAMGRSADNQWDASVLKMLDHEDLSVQIEAVHACGELAIERARSHLLNLLEEEIEDADLLSEVIWALSQIGGERVRETLEGLQDITEDEEVLDLIEDALDNLSLAEDRSLFDLMDFDLDIDDDEDDDLDDLDFDDEDLI